MKEFHLQFLFFLTYEIKSLPHTHKSNFVMSKNAPIRQCLLFYQRKYKENQSTILTKYQNKIAIC